MTKLSELKPFDVYKFIGTINKEHYLVLSNHSPTACKIVGLNDGRVLDTTYTEDIDVRVLGSMVFKKRHSWVNINKIKELFAKGKTHAQIAKELGCSRGIVYYHLQK